MLNKIQLKHILFLDIETVPECQDFEALSKIRQDLWEQKSKYKRAYESKQGEEVSAADYYKKAGIWAEFGKIICISVGYFNIDKNSVEFRVKSFFGDNEKQLLTEFSNLLETSFEKKEHLLCGHNIKEFDVPYIARRLLINALPLPKSLNLMGKKPWDVPHLDTLELWKFGDYKHFTSLKLLTEILGIPSPKDDIDGSQVRDVYYDKGDLNRIKTYCEKDVVAVAQVVLRLMNKPLLSSHQIISVE
jgi:predicted PolB exonuclease-like 3'-5' exonuclease